jgi:hypothetical protein
MTSCAAKSRSTMRVGSESCANLGGGWTRAYAELGGIEMNDDKPANIPFTLPRLAADQTSLSLDQVRTMRKQLQATRDQLDQLDKQLAHLENLLAPFVGWSDAVASVIEPFASRLDKSVSQAARLAGLTRRGNEENDEDE